MLAAPTRSPGPAPLYRIAENEDRDGGTPWLSLRARRDILRRRRSTSLTRMGCGTLTRARRSRRGLPVAELRFLLNHASPTSRSATCCRAGITSVRVRRPRRRGFWKRSGYARLIPSAEFINGRTLWLLADRCSSNKGRSKRETQALTASSSVPVMHRGQRRRASAIRLMIRHRAPHREPATGGQQILRNQRDRSPIAQDRDHVTLPLLICVTNPTATHLRSI